MARKKKRRLGINSEDKQNVRTSIDDSFDGCRREFRESREEQLACITGVGLVEHKLYSKGYSLGGRRRR